MSGLLPGVPPDRFVVVPGRPGPLASLTSPDRPRDEIEDLLDEMFGSPDDRGPGAVDGVLLAGGAAAVLTGQLASLPTAVTVGGVVAIALGSVLPIRSLYRRSVSARRDARLRALVGDGVLMRTDHPDLGALVDAHDRVVRAAAELTGDGRRAAEDVAHTAVLEVASLLHGGLPAAASELAYARERAIALADLAEVVERPDVRAREDGTRRAAVEARREVEQAAGGSSVTEAAALARRLLDRR